MHNTTEQILTISLTSNYSSFSLSLSLVYLYIQDQHTRPTNTRPNPLSRSHISFNQNKQFLHHSTCLLPLHPNHGRRPFSNSIHPTRLSRLHNTSPLPLLAFPYSSPPFFLLNFLFEIPSIPLTLKSARSRSINKIIMEPTRTFP